VVSRVNGKQVRHTIGAYPVIGLAEAREEARNVLADMQLGRYAREEPVPLRTLGDTIPEFIEKHARPKNRDWKASVSCLKRFEPLYDRPLTEIKRADVARVLDGIIAEGKPYRANRVLAARQMQVLFVTHSIEEALFLSDRVLVFSPRPARILEDLQVDLPSLVGRSTFNPILAT
jgi:hypothetical protein